MENSGRDLEVEWRKKDRLMKTLTREVCGTDRHLGFDTTGYIFRGDGVGLWVVVVTRWGN